MRGLVVLVGVDRHAGLVHWLLDCEHEVTGNWLER